MRIVIPLIANVPLRQFFRGRCVAIADAGVAGEIDLTLFGRDQQEAEQYGAVGKGFSIFTPESVFSGAELVSTVDATVELIVSAARVELVDGSRGGSPGNALYVSGITYEDTPAASCANNAAVAVDSTVDALVAASATRLELRLTNIGADPVAIGAAGLTWAKRAVVLNPGDTWVEVKGASLAWYGITDAGGSASVTAQELLA
jgi:hypothetical protein